MDAQSDVELELVANIWPIIDAASGLIQRVAARAYVLPAGDDQLMLKILTGLAPTDFNLANQYPIGRRFKLSTEQGTLSGTVPVRGFNQHLQEIVDPILEKLTESRPAFVGISMVSGSPQGTRPVLRFAQSPYTVITFLEEDLEGNLVPCLPNS